MPPKRRQKMKGRAKNAKKTETNSENMDSQSTQDSENQDESDSREMSIVLTRLSRKHLLNSSSEASDYAHKENIPVRLADPYDADFETTDAASTAESDMEYTGGQNRSILSPSRGANRKLKGILSPRGANKQNTRRSKKGKKVSLNSSKASIEEGNCTPNSENSSTRMDSSVKQEVDLSLKKCFPKLYASDTSTPQSGNGSRTELNDSAFGFESLAAHQELPFSPVPSFTPENLRDISTGTSGLSGVSSRQHSLLVSTALPQGEGEGSLERHGQKKRAYNVNLSCLVDSDDGAKSRKVKKKRTVRNPVDSDWAMKISAEFDDIEMFELSVE